MSSFTVTEEVAYYEADDRLSWAEGGSWPHSNHYGFNEAVVAAHFVLRRYQVLRYGWATTLSGLYALDSAQTNLLHEVVGPEVSAFFRDRLADATRQGAGQPDLFVFQEFTPRTRDDKIHYPDPREWFFVEVKGPGDRVGPRQTIFWREVAERFGPERIRLFRTLPRGAEFGARTVEY